MGAERKRVGREVLYRPTAAEVTANGEGPYWGRIVGVNADGSVDLQVIVRTPTSLSADADGTYGNEERDLINEIKARALESRKTSVLEGEGLGQFTFRAGSGAV